MRARSHCWVFLLLIFIGMAIPSPASRRVTVEQLNQTLIAAQGKPDADLAVEIAGLELTERLSASQFARIQERLPGEHSKQALLALADEASFLDLPAAEVLAGAIPDLDQQRRMMALTVGYVKKTVPLLPNFFATRDTTRFEETPQIQQNSGFIPYRPLHFIDRSQVTVLYRDGLEVVDTGSSKKPPAAVPGLTTWGVFGPVLSSVLVDAAQSKLGWSHWEQGVAGPEAVFQFAVPKEKSHYEVNYCCVAEQAGSRVANVHPFREFVGYHGQLAVEPATGTILRLSVIAELKTTDPVVKASIMVEYGPVEIGGKTFTCPLRSVSYTQAQILQLDPTYQFPVARELQPLKVAVSDVAFAQYHMFRADARVVLGADLPQNTLENAVAQHPKAAGPETAAGQPSNTAAPDASVAPTAERLPSPAPPIPEISLAEPIDLTQVPDNRRTFMPQPGITLRSTTRLVDVALAAFDKKGHPVNDLKPGDVEVFDNGRKQEIRFFSQAAAGAALEPAAKPNPSAPEPQQESFTNHPASEAKSASAPNQGNTTILLIDAGNLAFADLTHARDEMLRFLKTVQPTERIGLYVLHGLGFQVLLEPTPDRVEITSTLSRWMPTSADVARAQDEEMRSRQQMETVHNQVDMMSVNGNAPTGEFDTGGATDPQLRSLGSNPERDALQVLPGVARHLAAVAGHKNLVWVSSDNVLSDFSEKAPNIEKSSKYLDSYALYAKEALNEAHISIYPLDASQLEAGGVGADFAHSNVLLTPTVDHNVCPPGLTASQCQEVLEEIKKSDHEWNPGRIKAQMQQDTHAIQGVFRDLASATGGRALRRAADIAAELDDVVTDGRAAYLLSFTPDQPADDQYHLLTVKLTGRRDLTLRYRTGYLYSKEPATLKDRLHQAIWQPRDDAEIAVSATPMPALHGSTVHLNIAATDLELAELDQRWADQLDIFLVIRDQGGLHARVSGQSLRLRLTPATYQEALHTGIPFDQLVDNTPDTESVRLVVVDENSGNMGSVTIPEAYLVKRK